MSQWIQEDGSQPSELPRLHEAGGMDHHQINKLKIFREATHTVVESELELDNISDYDEFESVNRDSV